MPGAETVSDYFAHLYPLAEMQMTNREKAERWTVENPKGWAAFKRFALEARAAGHDRIAIAMVRERVRWEVFFIRRETFKISNSYSPILARMLMEQEPSLDGMFEIKQADLR